MKLLTISLLLLTSCFASERESIKGLFSSLAKNSDGKQEEKKEDKKSESKATTEVLLSEDCRLQLEIAQRLAAGCWSEQANGCRKTEEIVAGECPICDALATKQEDLLKKGCIKTQKQIDDEKKDD